MTLQHLLNVLVQIANKVKNRKKTEGVLHCSDIYKHSFTETSGAALGGATIWKEELQLNCNQNREKFLLSCLLQPTTISFKGKFKAYMIEDIMK
jgi:hypothetical protein